MCQWRQVGKILMKAYKGTLFGPYILHNNRESFPSYPNGLEPKWISEMQVNKMFSDLWETAVSWWYLYE